MATPPPHAAPDRPSSGELLPETPPAGWRGLLTPSVYRGDPDRLRRARLFNLCYLFCSAWLAFTVLGNIVGGRIPPLISAVMVAVLALGVVPYIWVRKGRLESGALFWLVYAYLAATVGLAMLGTIRAPSLGFYLVLVICAGFVFGGGAMTAIVVLCSLAVAGLIVAENLGWLPVPDYRVTVTQWVTATAFLACVGWLTLAANRQIHAALARAEQELAERRRIEAALRETNQKLAEALASVKVLNGLLPICAWCRKVREDEGYWRELESYITVHTGATFTHGICPSCKSKHFGGLACRKPQ